MGIETISIYDQFGVSDKDRYKYRPIKEVGFDDILSRRKNEEE